MATMGAATVRRCATADAVFPGYMMMSKMHRWQEYLSNTCTISSRRTFKQERPEACRLAQSFNSLSSPPLQQPEDELPE